MNLYDLENPIVPFMPLLLSIYPDQVLILPLGHSWIARNSRLSPRFLSKLFYWSSLFLSVAHTKEGRIPKRRCNTHGVPHVLNQLWQDRLRWPSDWMRSSSNCGECGYFGWRMCANDTVNIGIPLAPSQHWASKTICCKFNRVPSFCILSTITQASLSPRHSYVFLFLPC
jgi:hypothetical protein